MTHQRMYHATLKDGHGKTICKANLPGAPMAVAQPSPLLWVTAVHAADGAAASDALEQTDSSKGVEWRSPASGSPTAASPASGGAGSPISSDSI